MKLSIVMPCLNEAETLAVCINKAKKSLLKENIEGEIIIADNGSSDGSHEIAYELGARVIDVPQKGYGSALRGGIEAAEGEYIIMGDADDSYDFSSISGYIEKLDEGYDLVMGNRFKGGVKKGAMPFLHKYLGNPVLSFIGRLFFKIPVGDFHCGLRAFRRDAYKKMELQTTGMEFASEMVVKSSLKRLKISEVPTCLYPDGRSRKPHLRTWHDGWRHLRFLLMYSPRWLFLLPGISIVLISLILAAYILISPITIMGITFDISSALYLTIISLVGFQMLFSYFMVKIYGAESGFLPYDKIICKIKRWFSLEKGILSGLFLTLLGIAGIIYTTSLWSDTGFGNLNPVNFIRKVIPSGFSLVLGIQIITSSFMMSILMIKKRQE